MFLRKAIGYYLAWVVLHFGMLLIASDGVFDGSNMGSRNFWPFGRRAEFDEASQYDITEFLVYSIFPLAILIIISLVRKEKSKEN